MYVMITSTDNINENAASVFLFLINKIPAYTTHTAMKTIPVGRIITTARLGKESIAKFFKLFGFNSIQYI